MHNELKRILNTIGVRKTKKMARYVDNSDNSILLRNVKNFRLLQKLACIKSDR